MARKKPRSGDPIDPVTTLGAIQRLAEMPDLLRAVAEGFAKAQRAGLNDRLLILLVHDTAGVSKTDARRVLEALPLLYDRYCNPRKDDEGPPKTPEF